MANADGSVVINTKLDAKNAQKELTALEKKIDALNEKISDKKQEQMPLVEQSKQIAANLDAAKAQLDQMRNGDGFYTTGAIKEQEQTVKTLQKEWDSVQTKVERMDTSIARDTRSLERMTNRAGDLSKQIMAAKENAKGISPAAQAASKQMDKFLSRIKTLARRVLVFSLITKALSTLKSYMWSAIQTNDEAMASIAKLKGALRTLAQPILKLVIPAFTILVNVITRVVNAISQLVSMIFGTTVEESAQAAENLYDEQNALKGVGGAAKKASKSLASFDEINKISGDNSSGAGSVAPDFASSINDQLSAIVSLFAGAALLALGAILTFSGVNIPLGIGLMALGALEIWGAVTTNWEAIKNLLQGSLGTVVALVSGALLVIGALLVFSGANIPVGLGLMIAGAIGLATVIAANWDTINALLQGPLGIVTAIISFALLEIGAILLFSGANIGLGLGLMAVGALGMAATIAANWDAIKSLLEGPVGAITALISGALLVIGAILTFSGANIGLGIGMMIVGAIGLATTVAANWDTVQEIMQGPIGIVTALLSASLLVIGAVLLFSGAGIPLGLGLILAGAAGLAVSVKPNWNAILDALKMCWQEIKNWWSNSVIGGLRKAKQTIQDWGTGIINKLKNVLGIHSPSTETAQMGDYLMRGMANGISESQGFVLQVFQTLLDSLDVSFNTWQTNFLLGFSQFRTTFSELWTNFWSLMGRTFTIKWNNILTTLQQGVNNAIDALNALVDAANSLAELTGVFYRHVGHINVPTIPLPKLATGAVIPPNREFLAVLGDQKQGTNIETPLSTMVQAFRQALSEGGYGGQSEAVLMLDDEALGRIVYRLNKSESNRIGVNLAEV